MVLESKKREQGTEKRGVFAFCALLPTPDSLLPNTTVLHLIYNCYTQPAISIS
ncbi:MAG: hypothetical protein F6K55_18795 [Moorea sp. SIO4A3]|nr:hypothetical protein [Moorena sp. SIO4A3]